MKTWITLRLDIVKDMIRRRTLPALIDDKRNLIKEEEKSNRELLLSGNDKQHIEKIFNALDKEIALRKKEQ